MLVQCFTHANLIYFTHFLSKQYIRILKISSKQADNKLEQNKKIQPQQDQCIAAQTYINYSVWDQEFCQKKKVKIQA